jgi:hypothetical protein
MPPFSLLHVCTAFLVVFAECAGPCPGRQIMISVLYLSVISAQTLRVCREDIAGAVTQSCGIDGKAQNDIRHRGAIDCFAPLAMTTSWRTWRGIRNRQCW